MQQRRERLLSVVWRRLGLVAIFSLLLPATAHADGAFPDELQVFAPLDAPQRIVVATNYGLILSEDDGASWSYVCEAAISPSLVNTYGVGPDSIYALASQKLFTSHDDGCSWTGLDLAPTGISATADVFGDPTRDDHALVITYASGARGFELYDIDDGGAGQVYSSGSSLLRGIEIARSDPSVVYLARFRADTSSIELLVSRDHGQSFTPIEHPDLGSYYPGIAAVDPEDAATIYLRLTPIFDVGDQIVVSHDSGQTFSVVLTAPGALSAFAVDETHAFYVADRDNHFWYGDPNGQLTQLTGPSVRCLAARAGVVYACGDASADGFVLGKSLDHGASFSPLVTPTGYQTAQCAGVRAICGVIDAGPGPDAGGSSDAGDGGVEPSDGGVELPDAGAPDAGATMNPGGSSGCGCTSPGAGFGLLGVFALALLARRRLSSRAAA